MKKQGEEEEEAKLFLNNVLDSDMNLQTILHFTLNKSLELYSIKRKTADDPKTSADMCLNPVCMQTENDNVANQITFPVLVYKLQVSGFLTFWTLI